MPIRPGYEESHYSKVLTDVAVAWDLAAEDFVATNFFAVVPVDEESGAYQEFDRDSMSMNLAGPRSPGTPLPEAGFKASFKTYTCQENGLATRIPNRLRRGSTFDQDAVKTRWLMAECALKREIDFITNFVATTKWGSNEYDPVAAGKPWSSPTLCDIIGDADTGRRTIRLGTGHDPNRMLVSFDTHLSVKKDPAIIDRVKHVAGPSFNLAVAPAKDVYAALAEMFEVEKYMVAKAVYNTAKEGGTASYSFVMGKHALLAYVSPTPDTTVPSAGYTFRAKGWGDNDRGVRVKKYPWELYDSDMIEASYLEDMKMVSQACGYFFHNAVA